jgi:hypothetical protein
MFRSVVIGLLVLLGGCQGRSQLVVGVLTNLAVKGELSNAQMTVARQGVVFQNYTWPISDQPAADYVLPGSITLFSDDGGTPTLEIELKGYRGPTSALEERVTRRAVVKLRAGEQVFYRMSLVAACTVGSPSATERCPVGQACVEGRCVAEAVDPATLAPYREARERVVECDSGSGFIDTGSCASGPCARLPVAGVCAADEVCTEGTCYPRNAP